MTLKWPSAGYSVLKCISASPTQIVKNLKSCDSNATGLDDINCDLSLWNNWLVQNSSCNIFTWLFVMSIFHHQINVFYEANRLFPYHCNFLSVKRQFCSFFCYFTWTNFVIACCSPASVRKRKGETLMCFAQREVSLPDSGNFSPSFYHRGFLVILCT